MTIHVGNWAVFGTALALLGVPFSAEAGPAGPPVAVVVDLAASYLPSDIPAGAQKQLAFQGVPVRVNSGRTTDVGLAANHRLELAPGLTIDGGSAISRTRVDSFLGGSASGTERGSGHASVHYSRDWFDLTVAPGAAAEGPERGMALAYTLDNRAAIKVPFGWEVSAASHHVERDAAMDEGGAGADGSREIKVLRRAASGSAVGLGYTYGWSSPESAAVSVERQVAVSIDFAFQSDVNCSAEYRQGLSADAPQNLALGMDWDLGAQGLAAANFKADLALERNDPSAAADALGGAANLSMAMKF